MPKAFVSACYDLLHSGHVAFYREAARYGALHVALDSDGTVYEPKGRPPVNSEEERLSMVQAVDCVTSAFVSSRSGILDSEPELRRIRPGFFVVNADGDGPAKRQLCADLGVQYVVLERTPHPGLAPRSTPDILRATDEYREHSLSWKLSEVGAGGYLTLVSAQPIEHAVRVTVRTPLS
ncbi:MAG: adenylyltransferase/cytidyltransferase family protein [Candidatus Latescibacterota bacterium]